MEKRKTEKFAVGSNSNKILYVVGKKIISPAAFGTINPGDIESIEVIKNEQDLRKYTAEKYDGGIVITLKKKTNLNQH